MRPAVDPDYGWHVADGRHILDGLVFAGTDIYSWTARGDPWRDPEWLTEFVMELAHDTIGPALNSVLASLCWSAAFILVAIRLRRAHFGKIESGVASALAFLGAVISLGVRPQALEVLFFSLAILLLDRWLAGNSSRYTLWSTVAAGSVLWANTHGSFPLLIVVMAIGSLGLLLEGDQRWIDLMVATLIAAISGLANPWGSRLYLYSAEAISSETTRRLVQEWRTPDLSSGSLLPFVIELALAAVALVAGFRPLLAVILSPGSETRTGKPQIRPHDVILTLAIAAIAFQSGRHVMLFGIAAAVPVASTLRLLREAVARLMPVRPTWYQRMIATPSRGEEVINLAVAALCAVWFGWLGWTLISPGAQASALAKRYPIGVMGQVERMQPNRLLNEYEWGGQLIERDILPVAIDGRSELYGDERLARHWSVTHLQPGWEQQLDTLGVDAVLMPVDSRIAAALRARGWSVVAADEVGVLLARPSPHEVSQDGGL